MHFSWSIFFVVLFLGVTQLAVGVVFGRCLPIRRPGSGRRVGIQPGKLRQFARRLHKLVNIVADDVDQHQSEIRQVNQELAMAQPDDASSLTEVVLKTVAQIIQINERLQNRLCAAEEKLQRQTEQIESHFAEARTDPLTGLPNRRAFDDELARRLAQWQRKNVTFCLTMIDIDHFKQLNDRYGHPAGDHVLREMAEALGNMIREMDMIARVGGEEFAVVLPSTNSRDAMRTAERIRSAVASKMICVEEAEIRLTVSLGLAAVEVGDDCVSLVKRADEALYAAKRAGRNCGFFHNNRECKRIEAQGSVSSAKPAAALTEAPGTPRCGPDEAELAAACCDLRQRLAELAEVDPSTPEDPHDRR